MGGSCICTLDPSPGTAACLGLGGSHEPSLPTAAKSPSAQLLEQVAQLKSLNDTIEKLKVSPDPTFPHSTELALEHSLVEPRANSFLWALLEFL